MNEEIQKKAQGVELNPEDLQKVSGGYVIHIDDPIKPSIFCSKCGAEVIKKGNDYICPNGCK